MVDENGKSIECGESDYRNREYRDNFSLEGYWGRLISQPDPVIFDIGANIGQSVCYFEKIFKAPVLFCFEPDPDAYLKLQNFASHRASLQLFNIALSNIDGVRNFYLQDKSHLSSLRPINRDSRDSLGYAINAKNEVRTATVRRLDGLCDELNLPIPEIIKIDVQGSELQVLEGCFGILDYVKVVIVEVSLYDFYGESTRLDHVISICADHGLDCWDISKVSKNPKTLGTDWLELVFKRNVDG